MSFEMCHGFVFNKLTSVFGEGAMIAFTKKYCKYPSRGANVLALILLMVLRLNPAPLQPVAIRVGRSVLFLIL